MKAVSARFISRAMLCIIASSSCDASINTARGFPSTAFVVDVYDSIVKQSSCSVFLFLVACLLTRDLDNELNFHSGTERNLSGAKGRSCVGTFVAENLRQQLRGAVGHQVLFGERRGAVHEHHQFHDTFDLKALGEKAS